MGTIIERFLGAKWCLLPAYFSPCMTCTTRLIQGDYSRDSMELRQRKLVVNNESVGLGNMKTDTSGGPKGVSRWYTG